MGNKQSSQDWTRWPEEKRIVAEQALNCGDPRVIDFKKYRFPVEDPISMMVRDSQTEQMISLKNYWYPAYHDQNIQNNLKNLSGENSEHEQQIMEVQDINVQEIKGIVFLVHGFSDYCERLAHLGQAISNLGYHFFCMDQRGHGKSGGQIGWIPSVDQVVDDTIEFHKAVVAKYFEQESTRPPIYLLGHSFGCAQALNMLFREFGAGDTQNPNQSQSQSQSQNPNSDSTSTGNSPGQMKPLKYRAMCFMNPFFQFYRSRVFKCTVPVMRAVHRLNQQAYCPEAKLDESKVPEFKRHFLYDFDNPCQRKTFPVHTALALADVTQTHEKLLRQCKASRSAAGKDTWNQQNNWYARLETPIMFLVGEVDEVVCNQTTEMVYNETQQREDKSRTKYIEIPNLDHGPFSNAIIMQDVVNLMDEWFQQQTSTQSAHN